MMSWGPGVIAILMTLTVMMILVWGTAVLQRFGPRIGADIEDSTQRSLESLFLFVPVKKLLQGWALVLLLLALLSLLLPLWLSLMLLLLWCSAPMLSYRLAHKRRLTRIDQQLVDTLQLLASTLTAGVGFVSAVDQVAQEVSNPIRHEMRLLVRQIRFGQGVAASLQDLAVRVPTPAMAFATQVMILGYTSGAQQANFLIVLAKNLQAQLHMQARVRSLTAQARMQGKVMAALPICLFFALNAIEPENMQVLLHTPTGQALLLVAVVMLGCGFMICRLILQAAQT